ncbi:MAG: hypothetical protein MK212_01645 [Saprospiraceae bacterium]|nr:hypothetical protein [Saprospiraceae bacterium]
MKYILLYLFMLCTSLSSFAQEVKISEPLDITKDLRQELIADYTNHLLLYRQTKTRHLIHAFDKDLGELWEKEITFDALNKVHPLSVITNKKENTFFILYYTHKKGKTYLHLAELSQEAKILEDFTLGSFRERLSLSSDNLIFSSDKKYVVVYDPTFEGNIHLAHIDIQARKIAWQREFKEAGLIYSKNYLELIINKAGTTFLCFEQNNQRKRANEHLYSIYEFDKQGTESIHHLSHPDVMAYDVSFCYDEMNQKLVAAGLYSENFREANGLFYANIDLEELDSTQIINSPFDEKLMRSLTGERRKNIEGISNFDIQEMILRRDGGVILMAEQNLVYEYEPSFFGVDSGAEQTDYLFENILVTSIHPTGEIHWKEVLHKSQSSENDKARYSSFFLFKNRSLLRVLYNDEISWNANVYEYVLNGEGQVNRNIVSYESKKPLLLAFRKGIQISSNTFVALSTRNNRLRVVKVVY